MTFQFWWVWEEESSGAQSAPLLSSSQKTNHTVIPNEVPIPISMGTIGTIGTK